MLLSIIIPNYNLPSELLQRCIDSILSQNIANDEYEIIIVDDGSQAPPRWIKTQYGASNITLIEHTHQGLGGARNKGIELAKGKYIQFIDGDDTLQNSTAMQQCLDKLKRENADILRYEYRRIHDTQQNNNRKTKQKVHFGNTISGAAYMANNNLRGSACCYFIKKELIDRKNIRFTPGIYHEDEEFTAITHFYAQTLIESNAHIYNYSIRENSITNNNTTTKVEKRLKDSLTILEKLATFRAHTNEHSNSIQKKALQRKLTTLTVDIIINHLYAGKKAEEINDLCKKRLTTLMLYPIANNPYGIKFKLFRQLANNPIGLYILRAIIPTRHKNTTL